MNRRQRKIVTIASNLALITFSGIGVATATAAWYAFNSTVKATGMSITCQESIDAVEWHVLKYDDEVKSGVEYRDEEEFYLPSYDQYITTRNEMSNVILKAVVLNPDIDANNQQLYVDIKCSDALFAANGIDINESTSNICQFKATIYSYITTDGDEVIANTSITPTNIDTQYRTASKFFSGTTSGSTSFVNIRSNTPAKDRDNTITVVPRFNAGTNKVKQYVVYLECSYNPELVNFYISNNFGDTLEDQTVALHGDITNIDFRFDKKYSGAYMKVDSTSELTATDINNPDDGYMIVYEDQEVALDGSGTANNHYVSGHNYVPVEINRSKILNNEVIHNEDWSYTDDQFLQSRAGYYIGGIPSTAVVTGMSADAEEGMEHNITYDSTSGSVLAESEGMYLKYNSTQNTTRYDYFRNTAYTNAEKVQFYKYSDSEAANSILSTIFITGEPQTEFVLGDMFRHDGIAVTAQYSDGSTSVVTDECIFTGYNMNSATSQRVTVSYTEDGITANTEYWIQVTSGPTVTVTPSVLIGIAGGTGMLTATTSFFPEGDVTYEWSTNNVSIAYLDEGTIHDDIVVVNYNKTGYATITCTATCEGVSDTTTVNVRVTGELEDADTYIKVTNTNDLGKGEYLIVYEKDETSGYVFNGSGEVLDTVWNGLNTVITSGEINATSEINDAAFIYDPADGSFKTRSGTYIGHSGSSNGLKTSSTPLSHDVTISAGHASIKSASNYYLRFNYASNQQRFRYYKSGQGDIALYKKIATDKNLRLTGLSYRGSFKTSFQTRDPFTPGQAIIVATFNNGTSRDVTKYCSFTGYDMEEAGTYTVTYSYEFNDVILSDTYEIHVTDPQLLALTIDTTNATLEYDYGTPFSTYGLACIATYSNGSHKDVTNRCTYTGYPENMKQVGSFDIHVEYFEGGYLFSGEYSITIKEVVAGWKLVTDPTSMVDGTHVIIAAVNYDIAASKSGGNANYMGGGAISKDGDYASYDGTGICTFLVDAQDGKYAFQREDTNKWIYASGGVDSGNTLGSTDTINEKCYWTVECANGDTTIKLTDVQDRPASNMLLWNNSSPRFACYKAVSAGSATPTCIYRWVGEWEEPANHAKKITLNTTMKQIIEGDTFQISYNITPANADETTASFTSSDVSICTVSSTGLVTGVAPGVATIRVEVVGRPQVFAECTIIVEERTFPVESVTVLHTSYTLEPGESVVEHATIAPANATWPEITWDVNRPTIASISVDDVTGDCTITAHVDGEATVYVRTSNPSVSAAIAIHVKTGGGEDTVPVESVGIRGLGDTIDVGETLVLNADVYPDDATDKTVTWGSDHPEAITIVPDDTNNTATITGVAACEDIVITATSNSNATAIGYYTIHVKASTPPGPISYTHETVVYTVLTYNTISTSSGAPAASSATFVNTYNSAGQMTGGNSTTLTLSGYDDCIITGITLSMKSNSSKGAGSFTATAGTTVISSINDSKFNTANWYGAWSTSYVDITPTMAVNNYVIKAGELVTLVISASANSIYIQDYTINYDKPDTSNKLIKVMEKAGLEFYYFKTSKVEGPNALSNVFMGDTLNIPSTQAIFTTIDFSLFDLDKRNWISRNECKYNAIEKLNSLTNSTLIERRLTL